MPTNVISGSAALTPAAGPLFLSVTFPLPARTISLQVFLDDVNLPINSSGDGPNSVLHCALSHYSIGNDASLRNHKVRIVCLITDSNVNHVSANEVDYNVNGPAFNWNLNNVSNNAAERITLFDYTITFA